jgi:hypothetical protein
MYSHSGKDRTRHEETHLKNEAHIGLRATAEAGIAGNIRRVDMTKFCVQKCVIFAVLVFMVLCAACSSGDVLASYIDRNGKLHEITREEAYRNMGQNKEALLANPDRQKEFIENLLLRRIKTQEAIFNELDKEESYITRTNEYASGQLVLNQYFEQHFNRKNFRYNLPIYNISMIFLQRDFYKQITEPDPKRFEKMEAARASMTNAAELQAELERLANATISKRVRKTDAEMGDYETEFLSEAQDIAKKVKEPGADFAELAKKRSNHFSGTNGGLFGWVLPKQRDLPVLLNRAIRELPEGGVSEPVNTENGYYIVKMNGISKVRNSTLKRYFRDPAKAASMQDALWFAAVWDRIDKTVQQESGGAIKINYEGLASDDTNTVLLAVNSPQYTKEITLGDLLHDLDYTSPPRRMQQYGLMRSMLHPVSNYTAEERGFVFEWIISTPVLYYIANKTDTAKSSGFRKALDDVGTSILAENMEVKFRETIKWADDEEIQEYYNNNKEKYASLPSEEAKEYIQEELNNKRNTESSQEWKDYLITRYQARIYPARFEKVIPAPVQSGGQ